MEISESFLKFSKELGVIGKTLCEILTTEFEKAPNSIQILAEKGWFIPLSITLGELNFYAKEIVGGRLELVDKEMIQLLDSEMEYFEKQIIERFPHRKAALISSFKAHREKEYYLSIPVFFTQIEGICKELTGFRYFKTSNSQPATKKWVSNFIAGTFTEMFLNPMKSKDVFRQNQIPNEPLGLNRHDVLHGDSLDYGDNIVNSYKALSLLFYMAEIIYDANKELVIPSKEKSHNENK